VGHMCELCRRAHESSACKQSDLDRIEQKARAEERNLEEFGVRRTPRRTFGQRLAEGFNMLDQKE